MLTIMNDNLFLNASLSMITGTENAQYPLTNLKHDFTTKTFRSNENSIEILVDLQTTQDVDSFAITGSSLTGLGITSLSIYGSATTDFTGSTEIVINLSAEHNFGYNLFTTQSFRYWKIEATTAGSYVELSNLFLGERTQLTNNGIDLTSFTYQTNDNNSITTNNYGQRFIDTYNKIKAISGTIRYANKAEFETLDNIWLHNGTSIPLWVMADPDNCLATDAEFRMSGFFYFTSDIQFKASGPGLLDLNLNLSEAT